MEISKPISLSVETDMNLGDFEKLFFGYKFD